MKFFRANITLLCFLVIGACFVSQNGFGASRHPLELADGEDFVEECKKFFEPQHCPPRPYTHKRENQVLSRRMLGLDELERHAAFAVLAYTAVEDSNGDVLTVLTKLWDAAKLRERKRMVSPVISAMEGAKNYELARDVIKHVIACDLSEFDGKDFERLTWLIEHVDVGTEVLREFDLHLVKGIKEGLVQPLALPRALRCADARRVEDPDVALMVRSIRSDYPFDTTFPWGWKRSGQ